MIVWLASYPKSGNTLVRSILSSYFYTKDGNFNFNNLEFIPQFPIHKQFKKFNINLDDINEVSKYWIKAQVELNKGKNKKIVFLKTHNVCCNYKGSSFTDLNNTLGVIYIVRDPRNLVTSYANHFSDDLLGAYNSIIDDRVVLNGVDGKPAVPTMTGSWKTHYNYWKELFKDRILILRYEDLTKNKKNQIIKIFNFLENLTKGKFKINYEKLDKIFVNTSFENMKKLEKKHGFAESPFLKKTSKPFFYMGEKNDWKKVLDYKMKKNIEKIFYDEMKELDYI